MPEQPPTNPTQQTPGTEPSQAAPGGTSPPTSPPAPAEPWRAPPTAPAFAAGKTAEEILADYVRTANALESVVRTGVAPQAPPSQPQYQPQPPVQQQPPQIGAEDYVTGGNLQAWGQQVFSQQVAPQLSRALELAASANLDSVRRNNAPIFQKYGPEVDALLAKVPFEQRTIDNLNVVVDIVRGRHVEELASERASRLVADMGPTIRSSGGGSGGAGGFQAPSTNESSILGNEKVPASWRDMAAKVGLDERAIDGYLQANGMTREQFVEQFNRGGIVTEMSSTDKTSPLARMRIGE
jgi:hypothetical protein